MFFFFMYIDRFQLQGNLQRIRVLYGKADEARQTLAKYEEKYKQFKQEDKKLRRELDELNNEEESRPMQMTTVALEEEVIIFISLPTDPNLGPWIDGFKNFTSDNFYSIFRDFWVLA